jgi:GT2 family glycosyltransferase/glycosyltransferase involved in cell wall biosynthesis
MINFSFVTPTRGRQKIIQRLFQSILENTAQPDRIEIMLGIDDDDEESLEINHPVLNIRHVVVPKSDRLGRVVQACFEASKGRYICECTDDVVIRTPDWDQIVLSAFSMFPDDIALIHVNDLLFRDTLCTFPILSRRACEVIGASPTMYKKYRNDDHIYDIYQMLGFLGHKRIVYLEEVIFEHKHFVTDLKGHSGGHFKSKGNKFYVADDKILTEDAKVFDEVLDIRKQEALKLARLIMDTRHDNLAEREKSELEMYDPTARVEEYGKLLKTVKDSYSYRDPSFVRRLPLYVCDGGKSPRTTVAVVSADIQNDFATECLRRVKAHTNNYDLMVLDNNGGGEFSHPREMNKVLRAVDTDYLCLMDDDVYVEEGWLEKMLAYMDDNTAVVLPMHTDKNGDMNFSGAYLGLDGTGAHMHLDDKIEEPREIQATCTACILIDLRKVGHIFMDDTYAKYFFDLVYGFRVWEEGYRCVCAPDVTVQHIGGATMVRGTTEASSLWQRDEDVFIRNWVKSGRLDKLADGIWQKYPFMKSLADIPRAIASIPEACETMDIQSLKALLTGCLQGARPLPLFKSILSSQLGKMAETLPDKQELEKAKLCFAVYQILNRPEQADAEEEAQVIPGIVAQPSTAQSVTEDIVSVNPTFVKGNYAAIALAQDSEKWETYAAQAMLGRTDEALEGLARFDHAQAGLYTGVAHWMAGNDDQAIEILSAVPTSHAHNLCALISKPKLQVLTQWGWTRIGPFNKIFLQEPDEKFQITNAGWYGEDIISVPYADIHKWYRKSAPPDFYSAQMIEWQTIPTNIQELPCPIFAQTHDYDTHIQVIQPWLKVFDELLVTDHHQWEELRKLTPNPVATCPKNLSVADLLPAIPHIQRPVDVLLATPVALPYHGDRAPIVHTVLNMPDVATRFADRSIHERAYADLMAHSKICIVHHRHTHGMVPAALEALSMGCTVIAEKDCILTAYMSEAEGLFTYDGTMADLEAVIRKILARWPELREGVRARATKVRREFGSSTVSSQYLRFLTVLAAKPRAQRRKVFADGLDQKRVVMSRGWVCPRLTVLNAQREQNMERWNSRLMTPRGQQAMIDITRSAVIQYAHVASTAEPTPPFKELLKQVLELYKSGVQKYSRSLVLRFNYIRTVLHLAHDHDMSDVVKLAERTLAESPDKWTVDVLDDVFPYDFFSNSFNYREYLDAVARHAMGGKEDREKMVRLILASLHHHLGLHSGDMAHLGKAAELDPDFPHYRLEYARGLARTDDEANYTIAGDILAELALNTPIFVEACDVMEHLRDERDYIHPQLDDVIERVNRAQRNGHVMDDVGDGTV